MVSMSDVLKTSRRWLGAWVFPLALLALPNCLLDSGGYDDVGDPMQAFDPGTEPLSSAIMCEIPVPVLALGGAESECAADQDEVDAGISLAAAATALAEGQSGIFKLDFSPAVVSGCGGFPKKTAFFEGNYPDGMTLCLNCGQQIPMVFATPAKACIAKCKDLVGATSDGVVDAAEYCNAHARVATNYGSSCDGFEGACTNGGMPMSPDDFFDPRRKQELVQWTDMFGTDDVNGTNNLFRNVMTTGPTEADFNAGAASVQTIISGDAWVEFHAGENDKSHVLSLRESCAKATDCPDNDPTLDNIGFAISLNNDNNVYVVEKKTGLPLELFGPLGDPYTPGERFRVRATDNHDGTATITYHRLDPGCKAGTPCTGTVIHTHTGTHPSYPLRVDATFREENGTLANVTIVRIKQ
jgi:hypothetical protein